MQIRLGTLIFLLSLNVSPFCQAADSVGSIEQAIEAAKANQVPPQNKIIMKHISEKLRRFIKENKIHHIEEKLALFISMIEISDRASYKAWTLSQKVAEGLMGYSSWDSYLKDWGFAVEAALLLRETFVKEKKMYIHPYPKLLDVEWGPSWYDTARKAKKAAEIETKKALEAGASKEELSRISYRVTEWMMLEDLLVNLELRLSASYQIALEYRPLFINNPFTNKKVWEVIRNINFSKIEGSYLALEVFEELASVVPTYIQVLQPTLALLILSLTSQMEM